MICGALARLRGVFLWRDKINAAAPSDSGEQCKRRYGEAMKGLALIS